MTAQVEKLGQMILIKYSENDDLWGKFRLLTFVVENLNFWV